MTVINRWFATVMLQWPSYNRAVKDLVRFFIVTSAGFWSWFCKLILFDTVISGQNFSGCVRASFVAQPNKAQGILDTRTNRPGLVASPSRWRGRTNKRVRELRSRANTRLPARPGQLHLSGAMCRFYFISWCCWCEYVMQAYNHKQIYQIHFHYGYLSIQLRISSVPFTVGR